MRPCELLTLGLLICSGHVRAADEKPRLDRAVELLRQTCKRKARGVSLWSVAGKDGWLFMDDELVHVAAGPFWGEHARKASRVQRSDERDPLPAILDYRDRLAARGIELLLVPIPPKAIVYADKLMDVTDIPLRPDGSLPRLDPAHQAFYALLRSKGVEVLDPTELFLAHRREGDTYCKQDHHYSGLGVSLLATRLAERIKARPWYRALPESARSARYLHERRRVQISGDLWQTFRLKTREVPEREVLELHFVGTRAADGSLSPVPTDAHSPVLVFGGSHALIFHAGGDMQARGAGLPDALALLLGFAVDLVATRGDMVHNPRISIYRRARKRPETIRCKKIFIWVFAARGFTEHRWSRRIPLMPASAAPAESSP
ncbi:MAG: hypothetical protein JXR96_22370 [Deltaproteobacteria bacterium]|nr:hypothetical protein [Deltaproteobacteria bacterium]